MSTGFKITMAVIISVLAAFSYAVMQQSETGANGSSVNVKTEATAQAEVAAIEAAVNELFIACAHLPQYIDDMQQVDANVIAGGDFDYRTEEYGWRRYIVVAIKLSNSPETVPNHYSANGHTLRYYVGGGERPGVLAQKLQAQMLCGTMPMRDDGADSFLNWPNMRLIDAN